MPSTNVEVIVRAERGGLPGTVRWGPTSIRFDPPGHGHAQGNDIHIKERGEAEIVFHLQDSSGLQLQYREDESDAIWITSGTSCPNGPGNAQGEFDIIHRQTHRLTIIDVNQNNGDYCYALRFDSSAGVQVFDPIIKNAI